MNKYLVASIIVFLIPLFIGTWLFNHVNAWLGIGVIVIGLPLAYYTPKFISSLKKHDYNSI